MRLNTFALTLALCLFALSIALAQAPPRQVFWLDITSPAEKVGQRCILDSFVQTWTESSDQIFTVLTLEVSNGRHCPVGTQGTKGELLPYR